MKTLRLTTWFGVVLAVFAFSAEAVEPKDLNAYVEQAQSWLKKVESSGRVEEFDSFNKALDQYADAAMELHKRASQEAQSYNESKGRKGSLKALLELERVVSPHIGAAEAIIRRIAAIEAGVSTGKIVLSPAAFKQLDSEGRDQIEPEVRKKYEQGIRSNVSPSTVPISFASNVYQCGVHALGAFMSLAVSDAGAATAAGCYSVCAASFGLACGACLAAGGIQMSDEYDRWKSCRKKSGWRKAVCWSRFILMVG